MSARSNGAGRVPIPQFSEPVDENWQVLHAALAREEFDEPGRFDLNQLARLHITAPHSREPQPLPVRQVPQPRESHVPAPEPHPRAPEPHPRAPEPHPRAPEPHPRAPEPHTGVYEPVQAYEPPRTQPDQPRLPGYESYYGTGQPRHVPQRPAHEPRMPAPQPAPPNRPKPQSGPVSQRPPVAFASPGAQSPSDERPALAWKMARPYARTRGRVRPGQDLALETLVSTTEDGRRRSGLASVEHRLICEVCVHTKSVAEIAAHLGIPLGVVKILVGDLAKAGMVLVHRSGLLGGDRTSHELMQRVLAGLRAL